MIGNPYGINPTARLDIPAIRRWTFEGERSRESYFRLNPVQLPRPHRCGCGGRFESAHGLATHKAQHCRERAS